MNEHDEFERHSRRLLTDSADALSGHVRSRLTQARHTVLARATARSPWRSWLPAGAAAAAVLVVLLLQPHPDGAHVSVVPSGSALEDVELLTDNEAFELAQEHDSAQEEQDGGADFYEWAAGEAEDSGQSLGT
jgi:hypothetical protein